VRYEKLITVYRAFFHIACLLITLKDVMRKRGFEIASNDFSVL